MVEVHLKGKSMEQRIADRLRPSNDLKNADVTATHGTGPTRTVTAIHHPGQHGTPLADRKTGSTGNGDGYGR